MNNTTIRSNRLPQLEIHTCQVSRSARASLGSTSDSQNELNILLERTQVAVACENVQQVCYEVQMGFDILDSVNKQKKKQKQQKQKTFYEQLCDLIDSHASSDNIIALLRVNLDLIKTYDWLLIEERLIISVCKKYGIWLKIKNFNKELSLSEKHQRVIREVSYFAIDYVDQGRVNLSYLLDNIKFMFKTQQRKLCKDIVHIMDAYRTYAFNTNQHYKRFCDILKKFDLLTSQISFYKGSREKFVIKPQMGLFSFFNDTSKAANDLSEASVEANKAFKKTNEILEDVDIEGFNQFTSFVKKISTKLEGLFDHSLVDTLVLSVNKIYIFLASIYHKSPIDLIVTTFYNMVGGLVPPTQIAKFLGNLLSGLKRASQDLLQKIVPQDETEDSESLLSTIVNTISTAILGIFNKMSTVQFTNFESKIKKISALAILLRSCNTIFEYAVIFFDFIFNSVIKFITNKVSFVPKKLIPDDLKKIYDELDAIEKEDVPTKSLSTLNNARRIVNFRTSVNEFLLSAKPNKVNKLLMVHVNYMKRMADKWFDNIPPYLREVPGSDREKPVWIYIYGKPRIGKTSVIAKSIVYACAGAMKLINEEEKWDAFVFNRNLGDPYWEGYNGHPVVSYTDILQEVMDEQKLDLSITELTRVNDGNAYMLPMAFDGPRGKGKNFFTSKLIVSDAQGEMNISNFTNRCWSKGEHIFARRTVVLEVLLNPIYSCSNGTPGIDQAKFQEAYNNGNFIYSKDEPIAPKDAYIFRLHDPTNNNTVIAEYTDFEEAIKFIKGKCVSSLKKEVDHNESVKKYCSRWFQEQAEWYEPIPESEYDEHIDLRQKQIESTNGCTCFDEVMVDTVCHVYEYDNTIHTCFRNMEEIHAFYTKVEVVAKPSRLRVWLEGVRSEWTNPNSQLWERYEAAKVALINFTLYNPWYQVMKTWVLTWVVVKATVFVVREIGGRIVVKNFSDHKDYKHVFDDTYPQILQWVHFTCEEGVMTWAEYYDRIINFVLIQSPGYTEEEKNKIIKGVLNKSEALYWNIYAFKDDCRFNFPIKKCEELFVHLHSSPRKYYCRAECKHMICEYFKRPEAQSAEIKQQKMVVAKRTRVQKNIVLQTQSGIQHENEIINSIKNSMCRFVVGFEKDGDTKFLANNSGINLGGDVFMLPKHYWRRIVDVRSKGIMTHFSVYWPSKSLDRSTKVDFDAVEEYPDDLTWEHTNDISFIKIKNLVCGRDLSKKFASIDDNPSLTACKLVGIRAVSHLCTNQCVKFFDGDKIKIESIDVINMRYESTRESMKPHLLVSHPLIYSSDKMKIGDVTIEPKKTELSTSYQYRNSATQAGDCGMVLMHGDSSISGKIIGLHVAGHSGQQLGVSCPVYREDIEAILAYFKTPIKVEDSEFMNFNVPTTGFAAQAALIDLVLEGSLNNFTKNGKLQSYKVNMPNRTKISKSVVQDFMIEDLGPNKYAPAKLNKETINGVEHSPMLNALKKNVQYTKMVKEKDYNKIVTHISNSINNWDTEWRNNEKKILSYHEALNGIKGLKQMDMSTSAGFPFVKLASSTSKQPWVTFTENSDKSRIYALNADMLKCCEERLEMAKLNKIKPTFFIDTLKDETRPIEKVLNFKTRLFQVGPFDLSVVMRRYMGQFMAHMMNSSLIGESGLGINPESKDWTFLIKKMRMAGLSFVCGDYSNYDASLHLQIAYCVSEVINRWYGDCEENCRVRTVLILTCFTSEHIVDSLVYLITCNPSGNVLTTITNVIANMFFFRWVYLQKVSNYLCDFEHHLSCIFWGDDNLASVSNQISDRFNMQTLQDTLALINVTYTTADKSVITKTLLSQDEITFLKRSWVYNSDLRLYMSPLDLDTLLETARWSQSDPLNVGDQLARFNSTLMFASAYGEDYFNKLYKLFTGYCLELRSGAICVDKSPVFLEFNANLLFTYERCLEIMYPEQCKQYIDLISCFGKKHEILQCVGSDLPPQVVFHLQEQSDCIPLVEKTITRTSINDNDKMLAKYQKNLPVVSGDWDDVEDLIGFSFEPQSHEMRDKRQITTKRVRTVKVTPQMEGATLQSTLPENMGKEEHVETITTFNDQNINHEDSMLIPATIFNNTMPVPDLNKFLERPILIDIQNWATTDPIGVSRGIYNFPSVLFTNTFMDKLEKVAFWRPDIEVTVRMNGTPMHYGKILFGWIPQGNSLSANYYTSYQSMYGNHWLQISANSNQPVSFRIPYTHYKEFISVGKVNEDLFTLFSYTVLPLMSMNGAAPNINYSIYARVVKPDLIGYNYVTDWVTQSEEIKVGRKRVVKGSNEALTKTTENKVVSGSVLSLGDSVAKFDWIPYLGTFANPIAKGIKTVGNVLAYLGLSVPPNLEMTHPMQFRQPRLLQFEDTPTTLTMGPLADHNVAKDYMLVNDQEDSASILKFMQRPALHYTGQINSTNAAGTNVFTQTVHPMVFVSSDYVNNFNPLAYVFTPLAYMTSYARLWRGGIRVHIAFVCSKFHSARVKIWYIPYQSGTGSGGAPNINELQSTDVISTILDVTQETNYSFTIPYCQQQEWLEVVDPVSPFSPRGTGYSNGWFGIQIINELTAGASTVNPIYYQVFVSAADDFQLALPDLQGRTNFGYTLQSDFNVEECEIPSSSMECLASKEYPAIGNIGTGRTNHKTYMTAELSSVKQLTNMLAPFQSALSSGPGPAPFTLNMLGDLSTYVHSGSFLNYQLNIMQAFRYFRGGTRYSIRSIDQNFVAQVETSYTNQVGATYNPPPGGTYDINDIVTAPPNGITISNAQFTKAENNPVDVVIPWYYKYKSAPTAFAVSPPGLFDDRFGLSVSFYCNSPGNEYLCFFQSGADDFILGYQLGPPVMTTTAP